MLIEFSLGKIIATPNEVVIKLAGPGRVTLQAQADAVMLYGGGNVIAVRASEASWSISLDNAHQLTKVAEQLGIAIS